MIDPRDEMLYRYKIKGHDLMKLGVKIPYKNSVDEGMGSKLLLAPNSYRIVGKMG